LGTAFSFTKQPGYPALSVQDEADFEALLQRITDQYRKQNPISKFDAKTWLTTVLQPTSTSDGSPCRTSQKVLVLADPDTGCNFSGTTLQYADGSDAPWLDFLKLNLFVRLWKKLGWSLDETDRALQAFFPHDFPAFCPHHPPASDDSSFATVFSEAWKTALVYLAHLDDLNARLAPTLGRVALLPLWTDLATQGESPLYAQLFLTRSVLNNDFAFDDPSGRFPSPVSDLTTDQLSAHSVAIQGILGLTAPEVDAVLKDAGIATSPAFTLGNLSTCYRYSLLAQCLQISVSDMIALKAMSGLNPFQGLATTPLKVLADDILLNQTLAFVKQVAAVQNSGFNVEDLKYLLRHQFDPVGKYRTDTNTLMVLVQSIAGGLKQIQAQNAVPADLASISESLIDQRLSALFPAALLKDLFRQLTNSQTYTASASSGTALNDADFEQAPDLIRSYDTFTRTQTLSYKGLLLDSRKAQLQKLNKNPGLDALLSGLLDTLQEQARTALNKSFADLLAVWASLVQYEAVETDVASSVDPDEKLATGDASLTLSYDEADQLQWLGYRGVLTDAKLSSLTKINASPILAKLLANVQSQATPAYNQLTGSLLAMWCNSQTYKVVQDAVPPADQIDAAAFAAALANAEQEGAITDPVPAIQLNYDPDAQSQSFACTGVLTDAMRAYLATLLPSPILPALLTSVRGQAVQLFQKLGADLLAPTLGDPGPFLKSFSSIDPAKQQKFAKTELVKVFPPLVVRKLSRQLVLQTLSVNLGSDPSLTQALITDAALLNDPNNTDNPGKSLLQAFMGVVQQGVSAAYYNSPDQTGTPYAHGVAATPDTADPTDPVSGSATGSCHFEGFQKPWGKWWLSSSSIRSAAASSAVPARCSRQSWRASCRMPFSFSPKLRARPVLRSSTSLIFSLR
jgi:hypothetical protein